MARGLIARSADVNAKSNSGTTVPMEAAAQGSPSVVKSLLAHGAAVGALGNEQSQTALALAHAHRHP